MPDGIPLRKTPTADAFRQLVVDIRIALALKESREKLNAILLRAQVERQAGAISELQYHTLCTKWHAVLVNLMKRNV